MKTRETIYVRGPKVLLQDFAWLVGLCQELIATGDSEERMRFVKYAAPQCITILGASVFCFAFALTTSVTTLGLVMTVLVPLFFVYGSLLDITRRIRPLNEGPLAGALVLETSRSSGGLWAIRVQSMGLIFDCHIPPVLRVQHVAPGDQVVIGRHPHDSLIAAIVDATPQAILTNKRRHECAKFLERQKPFKERSGH